MRKLLLFSTLAFSIASYAQQPLSTPANGGNKKASVSEKIGLTDVIINYDRPGVKGREGKVYGTNIVHYGFKDLGFGTSKQAPWRAGANENTTIEFSTDVKVEGKELSAGKYGFHIAVGENESTLIFSKNYTSWGSFFYDAKEDALRVTVKPVKTTESKEWLLFEFTNETDNSAVINLEWEKWKFPFKVEVDLVKTQLASFRNELRSNKGFDWKAWVQAAQFCVANNTNLDEALTWAETSISGVFVGEKNFTTLSTKAQVLNKLGKTAEADALMKEALPLGKMVEIHGYARQLLQQKKAQEAYNAFKLNAEKYPGVFTTNMGMVRGLSAIGKYKEALEYAQKALPQAPDANNKANVETMIGKLKENKDVN